MHVRHQKLIYFEILNPNQNNIQILTLSSPATTTTTNKRTFIAAADYYWKAKITLFLNNIKFKQIIEDDSRKLIVFIKIQGGKKNINLKQSAETKCCVKYLLYISSSSFVGGELIRL